MGWFLCILGIEFRMLKYWRLFYIGYVLLKHRNNIAMALEDLGPAFIKLGQFLSTRPDLIGIERATYFGYLRDKLPYFPFSEVRTIISEEFKQEVEDLYLKFEEIPIAAASIAQVHKAITADGREVAVKIRRPGIEKKLNKEIKFFYFLAKKIECFFPRYKRLKLLEVVKILEKSFKFELDLRLEAAAADELFERNNLEYVHIPKVDWLRTTSRVFTMEWIEATSIYEQDKLLENGIDLKKLASNFAVMFCKQAFVNGFFHADLHQGNIMVDNQSRIVLLDFGIMGRLDYNNRIYVAQILNGFLNKDYHLIAKIHQQAGYLSKDYMPELFAQSCRAIGEPIMNLAPNQISMAKLLGQLFKVTEDFHMETQPQLLLLQKTMIMVEGIGKALCPEENLWRLAEGWIRQWASENISVEAKIAKLGKKILQQLLEKVE
jgi:ubiquinone biosynthesis protein